MTFVPLLRRTAAPARGRAALAALRKAAPRRGPTRPRLITKRIMEASSAAEVGRQILNGFKQNGVTAKILGIGGEITRFRISPGGFKHHFSGLCKVMVLC